MNQHEREFFISLIRLGNTYIEYGDLELVIIPPTVEQTLRSCQVYNKVFEESIIDGVMTQEENDQWMVDQGLWTEEDDEKTKGLEKDLERLKVEIFNARLNDSLKERIRLYLRAGEKQLNEHLAKKTQYYSNTCEGLASIEKTLYLIKKTTYLNKELYNFDDISLHYILSEWQNSFLEESQCRELARTEPWKSLWILREKSGIKLFNNDQNQELTYNQKNIVMWSQMYDNIQESMDCPSNDVIEDDDLLDGWFILQNRKREKERSEQSFEESVKSDKIKNSSEVFVMARSNKDKDKVESLNNINTTNIKKQREQLIKRKGSVGQNEFLDEKLKLQTLATESYKSHVKGGK